MYFICDCQAVTFKEQTGKVTKAAEKAIKKKWMEAPGYNFESVSILFELICKPKGR